MQGAGHGVGVAARRHLGDIHLAPAQQAAHGIGARIAQWNGVVGQRAARFHAMRAPQRRAGRIEHVDGKGVDGQQGMDVAVQHLEHGAGVEVGGDFLADGRQALQGVAGLLQHFGAARLGGGQFAVVIAFRARMFRLVVDLHGGGAVARLLGVAFFARHARIEGDIVGARIVARMRVFARQRIEQFARRHIAVDGGGHLQRLVQEVQGGISLQHARRQGQVVARVQHRQHAQRRHLVHGVALRGGQLPRTLRRLVRLVRAVQVRQRVGAAALRHAAEIGLAQRFGPLRQAAEGVERRVVVALVQAQFAQVEQRIGIRAGAGHGRQDVQRFAQQFLGGGQAAQLAHCFGRVRLAGADAARPARGPRQVQRALHPFECRFVVVQAGEAVADIDGGRDGAAQLAAFQRRFIALHVVAGSRAEVARGMRQQAAEIMHPGGQRRRPLGVVVDEAGTPAGLGGRRVAQDCPACRGRVGQAGAHGVAGAVRLCAGGAQFGVAARMVAAVDGDRREQPVHVGTAGAIAVRAQGGARVQRQLFRRVQRALQPRHFRLHQLQAGACQVLRRWLQAGKRQQQARLFAQRDGAGAITLAQMPGQQQQQRHALGAAQRLQLGFPLRYFMFEREHFHSSNLPANSGASLRSHRPGVMAL